MDKNQANVFGESVDCQAKLGCSQNKKQFFYVFALKFHCNFW